MNEKKRLRLQSRSSMLIQLSRTSRKYSRKQSQKMAIEAIFHILLLEAAIGKYVSGLRNGIFAADTTRKHHEQ
jgi:hypothetical protein